MILVGLEIVLHTLKMLSLLILGQMLNMHHMWSWGLHDKKPNLIFALQLLNIAVNINQ